MCRLTLGNALAKSFHRFTTSVVFADASGNTLFCSKGFRVFFLLSVHDEEQERHAVTWDGGRQCICINRCSSGFWGSFHGSFVPAAVEEDGGVCLLVLAMSPLPVHMQMRSQASCYEQTKSLTRTKQLLDACCLLQCRWLL